VAAQVPIDRLWHAVPCFPTISEVWLRLMEAHRDTPDPIAQPALPDRESAMT
jgi:hypothetical protein